MIDIDSPSKNDNRFSPFLHWIICNIKNSNFEEFVNYTPPSQPFNSGIHRYVFILYKQQYIINPIIDNSKKNNFNIKEFVKNNHPEMIDKVFFYLRILFKYFPCYMIFI